MPVIVQALDHIVINVSDVETSVAWYRTMLGVTREDLDPGKGKPWRTSIKFGTQKINLRPVATETGEWFTGLHPTTGSDDLCFLTTSAPEAVAAHLRAHDVRIEDGPTIKQGARGPIHSVYCRDPDGNLIEIASYEHP